MALKDGRAAREWLQWMGTIPPAEFVKLRPGNLRERVSNYLVWMLKS
jgi:hypothetical protein